MGGSLVAWQVLFPGAQCEGIDALREPQIQRAANEDNDKKGQVNALENVKEFIHR
jgi:hypothetical protein